MGNPQLESAIEDMVLRIRPNLERIEESIRISVESLGHERESVLLVAVTKYHGPEAMLALLRLGVKHQGENRIQSAVPKILKIQDENARFHFIGQLQRNKAREAVKHFHWVESVDRLKLARRLNDVCGEEERRLPVLVQVNVGGEEQKGGIEQNALEQLLCGISDLPNLDLRGLMCIPPIGTPEETRKHFVEMRRLFEKFRDSYGLSELSMGMSSDYTVAIEEGATIVRVGQALYA
jgi:pyridoxal phosphate enzyme (YggS family)